MQINNVFSELSAAVLDARHPDAAYFRVSGVVPDDLAAYLPGVRAWGAFWRDDHTTFRCERGQAGYVVKLLDKVGLNYTTNYQPTQRTRRKRGGVWAKVRGWW